jgi:hypothetical protein
MKAAESEGKNPITVAIPSGFSKRVIGTVAEQRLFPSLPIGLLVRISSVSGAHFIISF